MTHFSLRKGISHFSRGADLPSRPLTKTFGKSFSLEQGGGGSVHSRSEAQAVSRRGRHFASVCLYMDASDHFLFWPRSSPHLGWAAEPAVGHRLPLAFTQNTGSNTRFQKADTPIAHSLAKQMHTKPPPHPATPSWLSTSPNPKADREYKGPMVVSHHSAPLRSRCTTLVTTRRN